MRTSLMDTLAFEYEMLRKFGQQAEPDVRKRITQRIRSHLRQQADQRTDSLRDHEARDVFTPEKWRYRGNDNDGETFTAYMIIRDAGFTDAELDELKDNLEICILSPYDCTGKVFTRWIYWKRMPAGIGIVHRMGIDV